MGTFSVAQKIAQDSNCAAGGMMDRAAHLVPYLEDFRAEVLATERKHVMDAIRWFRNIEKFSADDVLMRVLDR
jgi:hypothetical protein